MLIYIERASLRLFYDFWDNLVKSETRSVLSVTAVISCVYYTPEQSSKVNAQGVGETETVGRSTRYG